MNPTIPASPSVSGAPDDASPPLAMPAESDASRSYHALAAAIGAVAKESLLVLSVDVPSLLSIVRGQLPDLLAMRPRLARLPEFELGALDALPDCLGALEYTNNALTVSSKPLLPVTDEVATCTWHLERLLVAARALVEHDLLPAQTLRSIRKKPGHTRLASDTAALVQTLHDKWPDIHDRTALRPSDLRAASEASGALGDVLAAREHARRSVNEAVLLRLRAFTYFVARYDEVRRGVSFFQWHQRDADTLAPSPYACRKKHTAKKPAPKSAQTTASEPSQSAKAAP